MRNFVHRVALLCCNFFIVARVVAATADSNWDNRFNLPGVDGNVYALATNGNNVYVGGDFISAGGDPTIQRIARWDGTNWFALGQGVNGSVRAIAVSGTTVYVGGQFYAETNTDGSTTNGYYVAKWDGSAWRGFGNGPNSGVGGYVNSLAVIGSSLYVGGNFPNVNNPDNTFPIVNNIARWDGATWSALGGGVNGNVVAIVPSATGIYAGGLFTQATQANSNLLAVIGVAYWDGAKWSALGTGISGGAFPYVQALAMLNNNLYVGGSFTAAGGGSANYVAKWNGASWSPLGSSVSNGVDGTVIALTVKGTNLYVGGAMSLTKAADGSKVSVASEAGWDGTHWFALGRSTGSAVYALAAGAAGLYVGGNVLTGMNSDLSQVFVSGLVVWTGTNWNTIGPGLGMGDQTYAESHAVSAIAVLGTNIYAGGSFSTAGGVVSGSIARFDGNRWNAVGHGAGYTVYALAPSGTNLYVGGSFLQPEQTNYALVNAYRIARWDGYQWFTLGSGVNDEVYAIACNGTNVFIGGRFITATQQNSSTLSTVGIARWDGTAWNALGTGVNGFVYALAMVGTNLYAGGIFTIGGGVNATNLARWDGANWFSVGGGVQAIFYPPVRALVTDGTNLYVGGSFSMAGGVTANSVARWDGSSWNALGAGVSGELNALALSGGNLFAGGTFTAAGGAPATYVAKWNGASWSALGSGATNSTISNVGVNAIAIMGTNVFFGGSVQSCWRRAILLLRPLDRRQPGYAAAGGNLSLRWRRNRFVAAVRRRIHASIRRDPVRVQQLGPGAGTVHHQRRQHQHHAARRQQQPVLPVDAVIQSTFCRVARGPITRSFTGAISISAGYVVGHDSRTLSRAIPGPV